jgi:hypothetical protein
MILRDLTSPRALLGLFLVFCFVGYELPTLTAFFTANRGVQVEIDAKIESGRIVELYVNGYRNPPLTVPITTGVRRTYIFPRIADNVNFLRIDLGKISGATVDVYGITISVDGKVAKQYEPDVIYQWVQSQPDSMQGPAEKHDDHVAYVQKVYGPSLLIYDLFAGGIPPALQWLLPQDRNGIVIIFCGTFLILIALARSPLRIRGQTLLILIGVPTASLLIVRVAYAIINWPDPVDQAVGRAGFFGLSTAPNRIAAGGTLLAALLLSAGAIFITCRARLWNANTGATDDATADASIGLASQGYDRYRVLRGFVAAFVVLVIASLYLSEVYPKILNLRVPFTNDWDANNVNFWQYLVYQGFRPLRDFWFPYGGTWIFALPAPWGQLSEASMRAAVYITFFLAVIRLCGIIPAILILYVVLVSDGIQLMWAPWRYLLGVNVALAYVAIGEARLQFNAGHLLFGVALSLALFFEPVQVLYAAPAILAKLLLDVFERKTPFGGGLVRRLVAEFSLPLASLIIYFSLISDVDELREIVMFMLSLGPHAYATAVPTDLAKDVQWPFGVGLLLLAGPSALIGAGLYRKLSGTSTAPAIDDVLITLGIVGFMYFQKHLVRPVEWQFTTPTLIAMLIWLVSDPAFRRGRVAVIGGVAAGIVFWSFNLTGAPGNLFREMIAAPQNAVDSIRVIISSPDVVTQARDNTYSPERFSTFPNLNNIAARLRALGGGEIPNPLYIIGDTPMLYALLHQVPPYNTNDFNTSPILEQRRVVDWIVQNRPNYAVWNTNDLQFDGFPRTVRLPLLYALDAATFVPAEILGEFAILKRRADGEAPALAWWRDRLGSKIDLGGLLRRSSFDRLADCIAAPSLERCTPFLEITVPAELRSQPRLAVLVAVGDLTFRIEFSPSPAIGTYHVRLNRLWFWDAARLAQLPFRIVGAENPAVTVTLVTKAPDDRSLY